MMIADAKLFNRNNSLQGIIERSLRIGVRHIVKIVRLSRTYKGGGVELNVLLTSTEASMHTFELSSSDLTKFEQTHSIIGASGLLICKCVWVIEFLQKKVEAEQG